MSHHLHIDCFAGLAGDMFLGACIDLGASLADIEAALKPLGLSDQYRLTAEPTLLHSIRAIDFRVLEPGDDTVPKGGGSADAHGHDHNHSHAHQHAHGKHEHQHDHHHEHEHEHEHGHGHSHSHSHSHSLADHHSHDHGHSHDHHHHHHHHHTGYSDIRKMIAKLDTSDRARQRAEAILLKLAEAEATVHGKGIEEVHFHEVGAIDSIVDMLGAAVAMELLDVDSVSCAALPLGQGFVRCAHGRMPLPAPATALILRDVPTYGVERRLETVTPTGAAIAAGVCDTFGPQPTMTVTRIGYGAGDRDDPDIPNMVRLMLGSKA